MQSNDTTEPRETKAPGAIGTDPMGWTWSIDRPWRTGGELSPVLTVVPCDVIDPPTDRLAAAILGARLATRETGAVA